MDKKLLLLLALSILLESSVTTLPLTLAVLIIAYCLSKEDIVFVYAAIGGSILDTALVRPVGATSMFFLCFLFLIFLYQKKFEISSYYFVFLALFVGYVISLYLYALNSNFLMVFLIAFLGTGVYTLFQKFSPVKISR